jgi:hypothetical protein
MSPLDAQSPGRFRKVVLNTDGIAQGAAQWIVGRLRNFSGSCCGGGFILIRTALLGATPAFWLPERGPRG